MKEELINLLREHTKISVNGTTIDISVDLTADQIIHYIHKRDLLILNALRKSIDDVDNLPKNFIGND